MQNDNNSLVDHKIIESFKICDNNCISYDVDCVYANYDTVNATNINQFVEIQQASAEPCSRMIPFMVKCTGLIF